MSMHAAQVAHGGLARWAVGVAAATAVVVTAGATTVLVAYSVSGDEAISDTWVGYLGGVSLLGGLAASLGAFVLAVVAKVRQEHRPLLWLPLALFPVLLTGVVLLELFVLE